MIKAIVDRAKSEIVSRPLVAIDIILEAFAEIKREGTPFPTPELLTSFSQAVLESERVKKELWADDPVAGLFNRELSQNTRRFISVCLLRLLSSNDECYDLADFSIKAFTLFNDVLSEDLYPLLRIDRGDQTYEKQRKLKDVVSLTENELSNIILSLNSLEVLSRPLFRQRFMQSLMNNKSRVVIWPFLPRRPLDVWLAEVFDAAENYLKETETTMVQAYKKSQVILDAYLQETEHCGTKYSREYLGGLIRKLASLLQKHFENNPLSKPARLTISPWEKKYPFSTLGRSFNLGFIIENHGPGHAFEVYLQFTEVTDLSLEKAEIYVGHLGPTSIAVEIPVEVEHATDLVIMEGEVHWNNFDNTTGQDTFSFGLGAQRSDIDWDSLKNKEPYSLEPVKTEEELVGRSEILNQLAAQTHADSISSSYISGQKRIGKTSIAKTLQTRLTQPGSRACFVINLEVNSCLGSTAETTIQNLGKKLCEEIQKADERLSNLEIPDFVDALSPLSDFLDSVLHVAPDCRILFILDEFDVLPFELYRRGSIGSAFFGPLRAISGKPPFGFILVGGERMDLILDQQGIALNKFTPVPVDYFDRERHWHDFQDLVRKPVAQWLEISDKALERLFEQTSGNPFFTKLICRSLFELMRKRRDCDVTPKEIEEATRFALSNMGRNSFIHFWEDGIYPIGERFEEVLLQRKKMMVVLAETLRQHSKASWENIIVHAKKQNLPEPVVMIELDDFVRRQVLVTDGDIYEFKVPFFGEWLKEKGIREIAPTFVDPDMISKLTRQDEEAYVRSEEIVEWVKAKNVSYKGQTIGEERVRAWLRQFGRNKDQRLMFQVLQNLNFYDRSRIRTKLKEAHNMVVRGLIRRLEVGKRKRDDILVSYLDNPGKSGARYAKLYAEENDIYRGENGNVVERGKLCQALKEKQGLQALVFIDDFIGTGRSASDYFKMLVEEQEYGDALRNCGLRLFYIALCGFEAGKSTVEDTLEELGVDVEVRICDSLDETDRCFSDTSGIFLNANDREIARQIAYKKGRLLERHAPLGYGECEAIVVFEDSCPNDTLPILWAETKDWTPLFKR